jgi:hypothetical protein
LVCRRDDTEDTEDGGALAFSVSSASSVSKWQKEKKRKSRKRQKKKERKPLGHWQQPKGARLLPLSLSPRPIRTTSRTNRGKQQGRADVAPGHWSSTTVQPVRTAQPPADTWTGGLPDEATTRPPTTAAPAGSEVAGTRHAVHAARPPRAKQQIKLVVINQFSPPTRRINKKAYVYIGVYDISIIRTW